MAENLSSLLRHRVTLQQPVLTPDGAGGYTRTWATVATLWAQIEPATQRGQSREIFADQHLEPAVTHHVTIRYLSGVTADMRLLYGTRVFAILAVTNKDERNVLLQILAREGVS